MVVEQEQADNSKRGVVAITAQVVVVVDTQALISRAVATKVLLLFLYLQLILQIHNIQINKKVKFFIDYTITQYNNCIMNLRYLIHFYMSYLSTGTMY